MDALPSHAAK